MSLRAKFVAAATAFLFVNVPKAEAQTPQTSKGTITVEPLMVGTQTKGWKITEKMTYAGPINLVVEKTGYCDISGKEVILGYQSGGLIAPDCGTEGNPVSSSAGFQPETAYTCNFSMAINASYTSPSVGTASVSISGSCNGPSGIKSKSGGPKTNASMIIYVVAGFNGNPGSVYPDLTIGILNQFPPEDDLWQ